MDRRLIPINAWIALMRGDAGWPRPLGSQGLRPAWFEVPISTAISTVMADGVALSDDSKLAIVTEAKSGANVDVDQARKYGAMTLKDLRRIITINPPKASKTKVEVVYAFLEENEERILKGIQQSGLSCATLAVGGRQCRLRVPSGSELKPFEVPVPGPPPALIQVDAESSDDDIERIFVAEVVAAMSRGESVVPVIALVDRVPFLTMLSDTTRSRIAVRVTDVLHRAAQTTFFGDFTVSRTTGRVRNQRGGTVTILRNPADSDPRGQTQGWQRLLRQASGRRRRRRPEIEGQLSLDEFAGEAERGDPEK